MSQIQAHKRKVNHLELGAVDERAASIYLLMGGKFCYSSFSIHLRSTMADPETSTRDQGFHLLHRYIWLIETILRFDGASIAQIQECWATSSLNVKGEKFPLKSFHNHKTAIAQLFGINIICKRKGGYRYHIEQEGEHDNSQLKDWLVQALTLNQITEDAQELSESILLESIPGNASYLPRIMTSMRDGKRLLMGYQSFWKDHASTFPIAPYCLKLFKQRWYVLAKSDMGERLSIYALDRIQSLDPTEEGYSIPEDFDAAAYFADCYGIIHDGEVEEVRLKVLHENHKHRYLAALPLHASQECIEEGADYSILRYQLRPAYDFQQEILSHGVDIEVLSPQWLRDNIAEIYRKQYLLYSHGVRVND